MALFRLCLELVKGMVITMFDRPVWAEIDLTAIAHNIRTIKKLLQPGTKFCAVVKANAYGHGAVPVAQIAVREGVDYLAVAILNEAVELRKSGIQLPILILGYTPPRQADLLVNYDITQTVFSSDMAIALSKAAVAAQKTAKVHMKIDTGMSRIGIQPEEAGEFAAMMQRLPGIELEGVFSHFASADNKDKIFADIQFERFTQALATIESRGIVIPIKHIANSAATLDLPETHLDMVRPGIILYGLQPSKEIEKTIDLRPAMKLKAEICYVKMLPTNVPIGYGRTFVTTRESCIATLPLGYADGWSRLLSGKARVLINGQYAPLVGKVCMDQCMVDVTDIPNVTPGNEVLLFGLPELPIEEVAFHMKTINYEIVCMVGKRVPRYYKVDGKPISYEYAD